MGMTATPINNAVSGLIAKVHHPTVSRSMHDPQPIPAVPRAAWRQPSRALPTLEAPSTASGFAPAACPSATFRQ